MEETDYQFYIAVHATLSSQSELTSHGELLSDSFSPSERQGVWRSFDNHKKNFYGPLREFLCRYQYWPYDERCLWIISVTVVITV